MDNWRITVTSPDGEEHTVFIPPHQVDYMARGDNSKPFTTAAWLGYTEFWVQDR
jgi:hypothetical protein